MGQSRSSNAPGLSGDRCSSASLLCKSKPSQAQASLDVWVKEGLSSGNKWSVRDEVHVYRHPWQRCSAAATTAGDSLTGVLNDHCPRACRYRVVCSGTLAVHPKQGAER